jgi:hypothetical protein
MPIRTAHVADNVERSGTQTGLMMLVRGLVQYHRQQPMSWRRAVAREGFAAQYPLAARLAACRNMSLERTL